MLYSLEKLNTNAKKKTGKITSNNKTYLQNEDMKQKIFLKS